MLMKFRETVFVVPDDLNINQCLRGLESMLF